MWIACGNSPLYRILVVCVLLAAGCSSEEPAKSGSRLAGPNAESSESGGVAGSESDSVQRVADLPRVLIIGDSITAGFGLQEDQAFPALLQSRIDSAGYSYEVVNAGLSGETTSGGARRIDWLLRGGADVLVIELGGNDGLRGISPDVTEENLRTIIQTMREENEDATIILGGMRMPLNMGSSYREEFESVFPRVADDTNVIFIPHILEGVGGVPELNQPDGIHPTAEGQRIIADLVWEFLEP
ncbi:MAG: arylesterase, partial [Rhodothermia bacterium]|nr:arylesterase [Rhodothermia bacterium]